MDLEFNKNEDAMQLAVAKLRHKFNAIALGGGQKKIDKLHKKG
ncbi:MAG: hypothetical protein ACJAUH_002422, partial [Saprospiraceae bacterium]